MVLRITDRGTIRQALDNVNRIRTNYPRLSKKGNRMIADITAQEIRMMAAGSFRRPTGALSASIMVREGDSNDVLITAAGYAWFVDRGRKPGRRPPAPRGGKIQQWAGGGHLDGVKMSRSIGKRGTRPTRFIRNGMRSARPIYLKELRRKNQFYLRSGGRAI